jgi:hypothetical protein
MKKNRTWQGVLVVLVLTCLIAVVLIYAVCSGQLVSQTAPQENHVGTRIVRPPPVGEE